MLARMIPEQFEEWMHSDELDATISGMERLTWTVANGAMSVCASNRLEIEAKSLIPGMIDESQGQSPEEQKMAFERIAALHNASLR
jgi:uncharacterized protein YndB with AHSA1/START domain